MSNAFRYRITNATLYKWEWSQGWQIVQPELWHVGMSPHLQLKTLLAKDSVELSDLTKYETDEGTVYEYVPF